MDDIRAVAFFSAAFWICLTVMILCGAAMHVTDRFAQMQKSHMCTEATP